MRLSRWTILCLFLCLIVYAVSGQTSEPPKPRMTKLLMKDFMNIHKQYPENALNQKIQGTVLIAFNTDREGKVIERVVIQTVSPEIDSSALALFDLILWEPAKYYGKPKNGNGEFKIKYNISKYQSLVKKRGYDHYSLPVKPVDLSGTIYSVKDLDQPPNAILDSNFTSVQEFITANLKFPEAAAKLNIEGEVKLRFVIETNGLPSNISVLQTVGGGCTEEAIRILNMLKWFPGIISSEGVRTCYYLTIKFDATEELKNKHIPNQSGTGI